MSTIKYNKLVRDRIPEIIEASGKCCVCSTLSDEEYLAKLDEKLNEELAEYQESKSMEELADLLEVIRAVAAARGSSIEEVEVIRRKKAAKRGRFEKRILLTEVQEMGICVYKKRVDWLLFKDGFAIPLEQQAFFQQNPVLATKPGERKDITLIIDGTPCSVELRNLPINAEKNLEHAPIIQTRYRPTDDAPQMFKRVFWKSWEDLPLEKSSATSQKRVRTDLKESFRMLTTDDPMTFMIECHPVED